LARAQPSETRIETSEVSLFVKAGHWHIAVTAESTSRKKRRHTRLSGELGLVRLKSLGSIERLPADIRLRQSTSWYIIVEARRVVYTRNIARKGACVLSSWGLKSTCALGIATSYTNRLLPEPLYTSSKDGNQNYELLFWSNIVLTLTTS
jgi:hypothetical protein